jgi:hypothetical protein
MTQESKEIKILYILDNIYSIEVIMNYARMGFLHVPLHENEVLMLSTEPFNMNESDILHDFIDEDTRHFVMDDGTRVTIMVEEDLMKEYTIEPLTSFSNDMIIELRHLMDNHGIIRGTAGGFPISPVIYKWSGTEDGAERIKKLGAKVYLGGERND